MEHTHEKLPDVPPMSAATGNRMLIGLTWTAGFLGLLGLGLELLTERWLAQKLGLAPFFISTPMGVGAVVLSGVIAARIRPGLALLPGLIALAFWALYLIKF